MQLSPWPYFADDEIVAVEEVLRSGKVNYWTGNQCRLFEQEFAAFIGADYAISLSNGTVSLELALRACGIGDGDEVITTPRTFIASASAIVAVGATPILADVDPVYGNICVKRIEKKLTAKTKAIIPVHLAGMPCDLDAIINLAQTHDLYVIEDCAQAHGAKYKGRKVGSIGHFGSFSFCQDKIMTTGGEGGMLVCNDETLYKKAWSYKDHGKDYEAVFHQHHAPGFRWLHHSFGSNMRMTEMQAAIGLKQLLKLPGWLKRRNEIAQIYSSTFSELEVVCTPSIPNDCYHAFYKYYLTVNEYALAEGWSRDRIIEEIGKKGIPIYSGSCSEIYLERAFVDSDFKQDQALPVAKDLGRRSLMLLCHPTLTDYEVKEIIAVVSATLKQAAALQYFDAGFSLIRE
ncbi:MAG: DegT/DnrJ/EryC1/StrS family aminotransferase [Francisellaceae bacterium]